LAGRKRLPIFYQMNQSINIFTARPGIARRGKAGPGGAGLGIGNIDWPDVSGYQFYNQHKENNE